VTDSDDLATLTYEELVDKLEDLTRRIASGQVGIEEASELYERAGVIHRLAAERLAQVRARIERLDSADGAEGAEGAGGGGL
jgi:exodeoxyribonuclease VII small subunit